MSVKEGEEKMKRIAMGIAAASLLVVGISYGAQKQRTFTGEIMDSMCAKSGSHAAMEKAHGMPNDKAADKQCTLACVKMGGSYVLYNPANKTVYELADQSKFEQFAGEKVKITGTYDQASKTITPAKIQPAS
jgi:hypothetical protein